MNRITTFIVILVCAAKSANAQLSSPDSVVRRMFDALKAKDEKAFVALQPSREQMLKAVKNQLRGGYEWMKRLQKEANHPSRTNYDSLQALQTKSLLKSDPFAYMDTVAVKGFRHVVNKGEQKGIVWMNATFTTFLYDTSMAPSERQMDFPEAIKRRYGTLDFSFADSSYQLEFFNVIWLPSEDSWFAGLFGYSDDEVEVRDVVIQNIEEEKPPPPPPPPNKPKPKMIPIKTKKKSKD